MTYQGEDFFENDEVQIITFALSNINFGIGITKVKEIMQLTEITPIPNTPDYLEGIINIRGNIVPVIDLRKKFSLEEKNSEKARIIVLEDTGISMVGVLVDSVTGVKRISRQKIDEPPANLGGINLDLLDGIAKIGDQILLLLKLDFIVSTYESLNIDKDYLIEELNKGGKLI